MAGRNCFADMDLGSNLHAESRNFRHFSQQSYPLHEVSHLLSVTHDYRLILTVAACCECSEQSFYRGKQCDLPLVS